VALRIARNLQHPLGPSEITPYPADRGNGSSGPATMGHEKTGLHLAGERKAKPGLTIIIGPGGTKL
jgi:hypothetical protein